MKDMQDINPPVEVSSNSELWADDYWKAQTDKAHSHAKDMAKALERAKNKMLKAEPTSRMIEALAIIGEALAKHDKYLPPKNRMG